MRPMDADILEWVHRHHDPVWNAVFRLSHELATLGAVLYAVTARWLGPTGARRGRPPLTGNGHGGDDPTQGHTRNPGRARTRHPV